MQLPIKIAAIFAAVFGGMCLWFAIDAFTTVTDDPGLISGGRSFAWFWSFLAVVGFAIAWASWKVGQRQSGD
jgi:hypothetical protein